MCLVQLTMCGSLLKTSCPHTSDLALTFEIPRGPHPMNKRPAEGFLRAQARPDPPAGVVLQGVAQYCGLRESNGVEK